MLCASPLSLFVYQVFSFISLSFLHSSLFHSFSLWSGLFPVLSCSNLLSQFLSADWKMFNLNLSLYPDCFILWLNLDNSCAVRVHGTIGLVFSKTQRRPQEHKQDKNKEEWKRKDHNHVHKDLHLRPTQDTFKIMNSRLP